jgi:signal transduction histidine kinase
MTSRRSVRFYLALSYGLFVLVLLGGGSLIWYGTQEQIAEDAIRAHLKERARLLSTTVDFNTNLSRSLSLPTVRTAIESNLSVVFITPEMELRNLSDRTVTGEQLEYIQELGVKALAGAAVSSEIYGPGLTEETLYAAAPVYDERNQVIGAVCLLLPLDEFEATVNRTRLELLEFSVGAALLGLVLGIILATLLTRPLSNAQRLAARVAGGDYSVQVPETGPRELAELASYLNRMAKQLQTETRRREIVLSNLTHELARPLGGLHLGIESLSEGALHDPPLAEDLLNDMQQTVQRMQALLEDLALAARPPAKPLQLNLCSLAVEPLLQGLKARFNAAAVSQDVRLEVNVPSGLPEVQADELRLNQILANLVDNALKFTPQGGRVLLSAKTVPAGLQVSVQDTGPGIPQHDLEHVFEPFFQSSTDTSIQRGMGLGLAIAHQLALAHHGQLELENLPAGGLRATLTLSVAEK